MSSTIRLPAGLTAAAFMREYWQQRPLLMRQAIDPSLFRLTPEYLAGLACEEQVESRLVVGSGHDWEIRYGPFTDDDFIGITAPHWTLLVQDVDKLVDDVTAILDIFDFVPTWRIDDIMVSYASDGGGVGPHCDAYDVFLMQGLGRRRWRLSHASYTEEDLIPGLEQRILSDFRTDEDWTLEPGDVLYLPPGVAHWGTAEGPCMTYSLGFRAPSQRELAADWYQWLVEQADERRLEDTLGLGSARISPELQTEAAMLIGDLPDTGSDPFRRWLGEYLTLPKPQFELTPVGQLSLREFDALLTELIAGGAGLRRHPFSRLAWSTSPQGGIWLFCQGRCLAINDVRSETAETICRRRWLDTRTLDRLKHQDPNATALLCELYQRGAFETTIEA